MDLPTLERLLNSYGLPLAMFIAFALLTFRGTLRWGAGEDAKAAAREKEFAAILEAERKDRAAEAAFREQLRQEERAGRLEAERRLDEALDVANQSTDLSAKYERIVREKLDDARR